MQFTIGLPTDHVDRADEFVTGEAVMECALRGRRRPDSTRASSPTIPRPT